MNPELLSSLVLPVFLQRIDDYARVPSESAKLTAQFDGAALVVSGFVQDDHVDLRKERVDVWLGLPAPMMPPIGFANERGTFFLETFDTCAANAAETDENTDSSQNTNTTQNETIVTIDDVAACQAWYRAQEQYRKTLEHLFIFRYTAQNNQNSQLVETRAHSALPLLLLGDGRGDSVDPVSHRLVAQKMQDLQKTGEVRFESAPQGYRFTIKIPVDAFPMTGEWPLKNLAVGVDIYDDQDDPQKPARLTTRKSAFGSVRDSLLALPALSSVQEVISDSNPPVLGYLTSIHGREDIPLQNFFYFPVSPQMRSSQPLSGVFYFDHAPIVGQSEPSEKSPQIGFLPFENHDVAQVGKLHVYQVGDVLLARRNETWLSGIYIDTLHPVAQAVRPQTAYFFLRAENDDTPIKDTTLKNEDGAQFQVINLDSQGRWQTLCGETVRVGEVLPVEWRSMPWSHKNDQDIISSSSVEIDRSFRKITLRATIIDADQLLPIDTRMIEKTYLIDEKTGTCTGQAPVLLGDLDDVSRSK